MSIKGIILAGGSGTRLSPLTIHMSKQLLPVFDKPMIYYPLYTLMSANIRDILIITAPQEINNFKKLLGNGERFGIKISYKVQKKPNGIAEAFIIGKKFINKDPVCLILGDNIFFGIDLLNSLPFNKKDFQGAKIFAFKVPDPRRYGVVKLNKKNQPVLIEEKPKKPKSNLAVTGLYIYDNDIVSIASKIKPSKRNELEITDINDYYLKNKKLDVEILRTGSVWLDAGTTTSLLQAAQFVQTIQERQNLLISSPEELAFEKKWITKKTINKYFSKNNNNEYESYIKNLFL